MNRLEVSRLLQACAGRDSRTVDAAAVDAWHIDLQDIALLDALDAVSVHYRASGRRIMPADIRGHADLMRQARADARRAEGAYGPTAQAHSTRDRGVRLTTHVLDGLAANRRTPGWHRQPVALRRSRAADLGEKLMGEALTLYPAAAGRTDPYSVKCGEPGCACSHGVDPFSGERCVAGWLLPPESTAVQGDMFEAALEVRPFEPEQYDQVRACPVCAPERAKLLRDGRGSERRGTLQRVRVRKER